MSKLILMGGQNDQPITPEDLRRVISLSNQLREVEDMLAAHADSVTARLANGAEVQPGVHTAELREFLAGAVKHQSLSIDGVERHRRVSGGLRQLSRAASV